MNPAAANGNHTRTHGSDSSGGDAEHTARWDARDSAALAALGVAFTVTRVAWIAWHPDSASYFEESYRWFAAHELGSGPTRALLDYQADHYQGGSLFVICIASFAFRAFGESLLALKTAPLVLSLGSLATLYALLRLFFSRSAALVGGASYVAGPPLVAFWGIAAMGFHAGSTLPGLLQAMVFLGLLTGRWRGAIAWFAFGLAGGLGIAFAPIAALVSIACVVAWLWLERLPPTGELGWVTLGAAIGLGPWLAYNLPRGFVGLSRVLEVFGAREAIDPWRDQNLAQRVGDLLLRVPSQGLLDPSGAALGPLLGPLLMMAFLAPAALAGAWSTALILRRARRRRGLAPGARTAAPGGGGEDARRLAVFLVHALLFVAVYLASRFSIDPEASPIGFRLFPPVAVMALPLCAVPAARALTRPGLVRTLAAAGLALHLGASAFATVRLVLHEPTLGIEVRLDHGYRVAGLLLHRKLDALPEAALAAVHPDPERQRLLLWGVGWEVQHRFEAAGDAARMLRDMRAIAPTAREPVLQGALWAARLRAETLEARLAGAAEAGDRRALSRARALATLAERELAVLAAAVPDGPGASTSDAPRAPAPAASPRGPSPAVR